MALKVQDLQQLSGVDRLALALGLEQEDKSKIQAIVSSYLGSSPHIGSTNLAKASPGISFYNFKKDMLALGHRSPHVLAHELGHAASLKDSSSLYKNLLAGSKRLSRMNKELSLPATAVVALGLNKDRSLQQDILNKAALVSLGLSVPNLFEEAKASYLGVKHSPDKLQATLSMLPGIGSHAMNDLTPALTYAAAAKLLEMKHND